MTARARALAAAATTTTTTLAVAAVAAAVAAVAVAVAVTKRLHLPSRNRRRRCSPPPSTAHAIICNMIRIACARGFFFVCRPAFRRAIAASRGGGVLGDGVGRKRRRVGRVAPFTSPVLSAARAIRDYARARVSSWRRVAQLMLPRAIESKRVLCNEDEHRALGCCSPTSGAQKRCSRALDEQRAARCHLRSASRR